jgi:hypothetical protein
MRGHEQFLLRVLMTDEKLNPCTYVSCISIRKLNSCAITKTENMTTDMNLSKRVSVLFICYIQFLNFIFVLFYQYYRLFILN